MHGKHPYSTAYAQEESGNVKLDLLKNLKTLTTEKI
jgi:hypothetical protein